ncbi:MAG: adenosylcobalamin-dependent ribonucleoside-diphosphate reductase [Bacteroidetes bacterium]|nr:adenosylcobalamin-dependent ribonucleoside-diphosphate reductase [Bacteroidota bacterium]
MLYNYDDVLEKTKQYFDGDELAATAWINKYALKDSDKNIYELTPDDMHKRLSKEIFRIESRYPNPISEQQIYELLKDFQYVIPQGGPMAGIGNNYQVTSLSNCFVVGSDPPADSYGGILKTDEQQVQLMKRRGGVGHDLSHLRPSNSSVQNSALTSTGVTSFMERYSNSTREVAQDGRRGALMLTLSINHPDALEFIKIKSDLDKVTGANVSIKLTDKFMDAVKDDIDFFQTFPVNINNQIFSAEFPCDEEDIPYNKLVSGISDGFYVRRIKARELWDKIIHNAWNTAEPGILFWDKIISESPADCYKEDGFETISCNPCSEINLCIFDSCRLLAINLYSYVSNPFTKKAKFDFELFKQHIGFVTRIMDDIIDLELEKIKAIISKIDNDPELPEIKLVEKQLWENIYHKTLAGRRTGIGITAEGDMLAALGIQYASKKAIKFSTDVHKILAIESYRGSINMAKERGKFSIWNSEKEKDNPFIKRVLDAEPMLVDDYKKYGRRNISMLTAAPTGTVSLMTQTTSGIEPLFMPYYKRNKKINSNDIKAKVHHVDSLGDSWEQYNVFHPKLKYWMLLNGYTDVNDKSDSELNDIFEKSPYFKSTSNDIDWIDKVKMQGEIQKWVDHSISATVNLPNTATEELISDIFIQAWKSGCKGITVYRDGCRAGVLISNNELNRNGTKIQHNSAPKRPKVLDCDIHQITALGKKWVVLVGLLQGDPYEVFAFKQDKITISPKFTKGLLTRHKSGHYKLEIPDILEFNDITNLFERDEQESLTRILSWGLRHGGGVKYAMEQLNKSGESIASFSKAIARTLKKYIGDGDKSSMLCPECGGEMIYQEGCVRCKSCSWSKC